MAGIIVQKGGCKPVHAAQRAHLCTLCLSPFSGLKQITLLSTVFKAMETFADRAVCFTRKILVLFETSICSFVLKMANSTQLNSKPQKLGAFQVIPSFPISSH